MKGVGAGVVIPVSVNSAAAAVGLALEGATYATTSPGQFVRVSYNPFMMLRGKVSGGTAKDTAFSTTLDSQILLQDTGSTGTIADTAVGTLDYLYGYLIPLTGTYKGHVRNAAANSDNTSVASTVLWPGSIAAGVYVLRTYAPFIEGVETVATYCDQFNNLITGTETLGDAIGEYIVMEVYVDGQLCGTESSINIINGTAPEVEFEVCFADHVYNK